MTWGPSLYSFTVSKLSESNIQWKGIDPNLINDQVFECMVVRATLDVFWLRASKTVANHVREVRNMVHYGAMFGYPPCLSLGPGLSIIISEWTQQ